MKVTARRRHLAAFFSLFGCASMIPVSLLQLGVVKRLPDLPLPGFNSQKVNLSPEAFPAGIPDGPLALAAFAANLPLLGLSRHSRSALISLRAKASVDGLIAARYVYLMPAKEKAWCIYCLTAASASFGIFALLVVMPSSSRRGSWHSHQVDD